MVSSPFTGSTVAARYARARPSLHHHVVELLARRGRRVQRALDLACGTGLSTRPLVEVASTVVGLDIEEAMLQVAARADHVSYVRGAAEQLPFEADAFELVTVCSGIHWLEPSALEEARRVLQGGGTFCVYDVWFPAEMVNAPVFSQWISEECAPRYPHVARNTHDVESLLLAGFELLWSEELRYEVSMSLEQLVDYLMTHSERIDSIRSGRESEDEQRDFMSEGLRPIFASSAERQLVFGIHIQTYRAMEK